MGIDRLKSRASFAVAAHRGYKSAYPENTLPAFRAALDLGVDMLEFDLHLTRDREVVIIHDDTVDRTTNGTGRVHDHALSELKRLDAGSWFGGSFAGLAIPTLQELCELLREYPDVLLNVEIKKGAYARDTADLAVEMLREQGYLSRCVFTCFDAEVLGYMADRHFVKTQGFPAELMVNFADGEGGTYSRMWAIGIPMDLLEPERAAQYREMGLLPWCYCPDDEEATARAVRSGASLMTCNDPLPAMALRRRLEAQGAAELA